MERKVDVNVQMLRGLCAIMVMAIHSAGVAFTDGVFAFEQGVYLLLRNLIVFPVPVFFFLSGYFVRVEEVIRGGRESLSLLA